MKLEFKKLIPDIKLPEYKTVGSAGMDICSAAAYTLQPGEIKIIKTGFALAFDPGFEVQIRSRSGLAARHGIAVVNGVGTIDSDYRGEIGVALINLGAAAFEIAPGDRIAQMVVCRYERPQIEIVETLSDTMRGAGGFGSTGRG